MKKLAIITDVSFGMRHHFVAMSFTANWSENGKAGITLDLKTAIKVIEESGVEDINDLNGKACWIDHEGLGKEIKFIGYCTVEEYKNVK